MISDSIYFLGLLSGLHEYMEKWLAIINSKSHHHHHHQILSPYLLTNAPSPKMFLIFYCLLTKHNPLVCKLSLKCSWRIGGRSRYEMISIGGRGGEVLNYFGYYQPSPVGERIQ